MNATRLPGACLLITLTCLWSLHAAAQELKGPYVDSTAIVNSGVNKAPFGLVISRSGVRYDHDGSASTSGGMGNDGLRFESMTLVSCIGYLLELVPATRLVVSDSARGAARIDLSFHARAVLDSSFAGKYVEGKPNRNYLLYMLSKAFDFSLRFTDEPMFHYQLVTIDTAKGRSFIWSENDATGMTVTSYSETFNGGMGGEGTDLRSVANTLESIINLPVTTLSADTVIYKLAIKNVRSIGELNDQLFKYGLQLQDNETERVWKAYVTFK